MNIEDTRFEPPKPALLDIYFCLDGGAIVRTDAGSIWRADRVAAMTYAAMLLDQRLNADAQGNC